VLCGARNIVIATMTSSVSILTFLLSSEILDAGDVCSAVRAKEKDGEWGVSVDDLPGS
jgi:hypothetical protein